MNAKRRQSGLSLTEMAVVIAVIALLAGLALPAVRMVIESFESGDSATSMISSALASARALAAKEGHYVGVRFQKAYNFDSTDPLDPLNASQYMVFIIHDADSEPNGTGLANGFRAIEGHKPIKLPASIGVMDWTIVTNRSDSGMYAEIRIDDPDPLLGVNGRIDEDFELTDTTTFSVVFSPSGKLVVHRAQVRNRNGRLDSSSTQSFDDVFNTETQITDPTNPYGMFYQDDIAHFGIGLGPELSRNSFVIYDRLEFKKAFEAGMAWSDYLIRLGGETTYINPHTGTIILRN